MKVGKPFFKGWSGIAVVNKEPPRPPKHCHRTGNGQWRIDWNRACRSKYVPHIGAKQIAKGLKA